ncbi:MAG: hypothetical protein WBN53_19535 [Thermodesulfobacteriota bacterium]
MKFPFRDFSRRLIVKFGEYTYKSTKIEHGEIEDYQWKEWVNSLISGDVDERVHCIRLHSKWRLIPSSQNSLPGNKTLNKNWLPPVRQGQWLLL